MELNPFKKEEEEEKEEIKEGEQKEEKKVKKGKTVGDILKQQGIIKPLPKDKQKAPEKKSKKPDSDKLVMDIEKLRTELEMLKDTKAQTDDRIRDITEKIGEFRSLIFQRESMIKELDSKIRVQEEEIFSIKPRVMQKEMELRKKEIENNQIKMEKIETKLNDMLKDVKGSKEILEKIKSIENIQKMMDEVRKRVETVEKAKDDVDRMSGKAERYYIEFNDRMKNIVGLNAKVDNLDGLTKEMTKSIDSINIRLGSFSSRDDLENTKQTINNVVLKNREEIESRLSEMEKYIKIPEGEAKKKIEVLKEKERKISKLLTDLEEKYKKAGISEKTYNETREKNEKFLKEIAEEINETQEETKFDMKSLPASIKEIRTRLGKLESLNYGLRNEITTHRKFLGDNVKEMHERIESNKPGEEFTQEYKGALKTQTEIMKSTLEAIKKINNKLNKVNEEVKLFDTRIRFFETLNMIVRSEREQDIIFYVSELNKLIALMENKNVWNKRKMDMTTGLLSDIRFNWKDHGYEKIAKLFEDEIVKIEGKSK